MFDPISLIAGAGIAGAGWAVGRFARRKSPAVTSARCGCGHDMSMHDPEAGVCHAEDRRRTIAGLYAYVRCACRRYTGPVPIEEYFSRPILPTTE